MDVGNKYSRGERGQLLKSKSKLLIMLQDKKSMATISQLEGMEWRVFIYFYTATKRLNKTTVEFQH